MITATSDLLRLHLAADALAAGRFQEARSLLAATRDLAASTGVAGMGLFFNTVVIAARLEEGRLAQVAEALEGFLAAAPPWLQVYRCVRVSVRASLGEADAARVELHRLAEGDFGAVRRDWSWPLALRHLAEASALLGDADIARALEPHLAAYTGQLLVAFGGALIEGAGERGLGQVLAAQGRLAEATGCYERALALEEGFGAHALAARTRFWWARALAERAAPGDATRARELVTACRDAARALGMAQLESQAGELAEQLRSLP